MVVPVQKDSLTLHQRVLHTYMKIASPINGMFTGNDLDAGEFMNSRVIAVPDIRVDDYIVDAEISRIGVSHYEGSEFTGKWKNGMPPIEWRQYSMSRHRSFGYTVFEEQERYSPIKNLPQEYLARKMSTTVLRDHDKYLLLAIILGRMTGKLVARTSQDQFNSVIETNTGISAAEVSCTGNQADYKWIAQPGEQSDNEVQPTFATIKGMTLDSQDPLKTLDALTTMFSENWFDTNIANSERFMLITSALELAFRDQLIKAGTYVDAGFDTYKNADTSGVQGSAFFGQLRGWTFVKIHPEFMPKVFVDASNVVDPSPTLTGVGTAAARTLKQVVALAAYKGSAQTHDFFEDKREEDGGTRFKGKEYVQDFSYDAWVIDQKSEGIVPIFLPSDLDGNGTTDANYTPVDASFTRVAAMLATARAQLGTGPSTYPASGPNVKKARPEWYEAPYTDTNNIDNNLPVKETGDVAHRHPVLPGDNPIDRQELAGAIESIVDGATARANSAAVTLGQKARFSTGALYEVTTAGNTAAAEPSTIGVDLGETVNDGTAVWRRLL
ncbi:major capsid protein [Microbacterium phage Moleficent]|uniref:Uncharacterized protein n=1 Tax=Microbacterium phage PhriedRice TaxID=2652407 RepID=A0A5J6T3H7_9CAUD|nr:hypothetical protein SEA_PHRIEDRICE_34 [Microbacterium phage PhriedRice]WNM74537.1 major capsid protein [Microbacterium phage Moleficent]